MARAFLLTILLFCAPATTGAQNLTLTAPGSYVLAADSVSSGPYNIYIATSNVTLNLNGKTVRCAPANPATAVTFGIVAASLSNITIRNGAITGCLFGLHGGYSSGVTLEDVDFTGNTYIGAHLGGGAGDNIVRRCRFATIAGYTPEAYAIGINGIGPNGLIEDNEFLELYRQSGSSGTGEGVGALLNAGSTSVVVTGNTFQNSTPEAQTIGVWVASGASATVTDNQFVNFWKGVQGSTVTASGNDLSLTAALAGSVAFSVTSGQASGNTMTGYETAFAGGILNSGNTINPLPAPPAGRWFRFCVDSAATCYEGRLPPAPP